jgi:UTP--glucose-1-phosphate uridylyltransferase
MHSTPIARTQGFVKKVVIPVAGRGLRLSPATKTVPKVLLPIGRKPLIAYAVEEAIASGAECVILVTNPNDSLIRGYFEADTELDQLLRRSGRAEDAEFLKQICGETKIVTVQQNDCRGLADAIRSAKVLVNDEPFGVILPDALILSERPCIGQLLESYEKHHGVVIATRLLATHETERYGILAVDNVEIDIADPVLRIRAMVEKPKAELSPSLFGVFGRYVLEPGVFDAIDAVVPDSRGELQLTDALNLYCGNHPTYGYLFEGKHFDAGEWLGFAQATMECFLADPRIGSDFSDYLDTKVRA